MCGPSKVRQPGASVSPDRLEGRTLLSTGLSISDAVLAGSSGAQCQRT